MIIKRSSTNTMEPYFTLYLLHLLYGVHRNMMKEGVLCFLKTHTIYISEAVAQFLEKWFPANRERSHNVLATFSQILNKPFRKRRHLLWSVCVC